MLSYALYFFLVIFIFPIIPTPTAAYTATDFILLNCGASSNLNDTSNRTWNSDDRSRYTPSSTANISSASTASLMYPFVLQVPYETARVVHSPFTYTFPLLTAGSKFLRLYFYPSTYSNLSASQSFFSVTANGFTLLSNFSASLYSPFSFMKEFVINIEENRRLDLTFSPNPSSFAFINGIEIVSIPDKLYFKGNDVAIKFVDQLFYLNNNTALENLYRLNVGGSEVEIQDDSGPTRGMFRAWLPDDDYSFGAAFSYTPHAKNLQINYTAETPPYSAPAIIYTSSRVKGKDSISLEWGFPVDSGFYYLVRLHFCEIQQEVTQQNERVFTISINNHTAEIDADVIFWTGGTDIPIFRDYITWVPDDGRRGKYDLRLVLFPMMEGNPKYQSALLNGLEIFKLGDSNRSLASANPGPRMVSSPPAGPVKPQGKKKSGGSYMIYAIIASVIGVLAVIAAVRFLISRQLQKIEDSATSAPKRTSRSDISLPSDLCRYFSLDEIKTATCNFDDNFVIGKGGFGNVYKGLIDNGATTVAIKRLNPSSNQGAREFFTEIDMLSKLRHVHLVSLIGYCNENREMILVYDYMAHGTLRDHLYDSDKSPLTWKQRLQICLGAAKGLHYLHTGAKHAIIHRDVKSTNILLDEKWVAKLSDFGLSKVGPTGGTHTHVSTVVKGSFGYVDPEYYRRQQLTEKSDGYSFGVVLFEVLCARPAVIASLPRERANLAEWAKSCLTEGTLKQIIDSNLDGQIAPESLSKFAETAIACLNNKGVDRPAMSDVVWSLEFAIQLQEAAENRDGDGDRFVALSSPFPLLGMFFRSSETAGSKTSGLSTDSCKKMMSEDIFTEIRNPLGR